MTTAALFVPGTRRHRRVEWRWRWIGRAALALLATAVLITAVTVVLKALGATTANIEAAAAGLAVASVVWLPVTRRWGPRGHLCWSTTTYVFVVYLAFMLWWTFASHLGTAGTASALFLWLLELAAAILGSAYL